jgi:acyl-CoA thioesterase I
MQLSALSRRVFAAGAASLFAANATAAPKPRVVTVLGDSITAGYGLPYRDSLPAQLQAELNRRGANVRVRGAGVSGDTSAAGLARVNFSVQQDTALAIVALGGNDLLQGLSPAAMQRNLTAIVRRLKAKRIRVLLAGLRAPAVINQAYARQFNAVFAAVARAEGVPLHSDLLGGVAGVAPLNQPDRIHPNARGVRVIVQRLAPAVLRALSR